MKRSATFLVLSLAAVLSFVGTASAQQCAAGCGLQKKAALRGARVAKLACKMDCRSSAAPSDLRACMLGCVEVYRAAREATSEEHASCLGGCDAAAEGGDAACPGACGRTLGECARGVAADAQKCVRDCRTSSDRRGCLEGCAAAAEDAANGCAESFSDCLTGCGGPSPTTTTLPPVPSCILAEAPACGGTCPVAGQTCAPVTEDRCACLGGSPSGAFVE